MADTRLRVLLSEAEIAARVDKLAEALAHIDDGWTVVALLQGAVPFTADLMRAFYGHLAAGLPRPEALRRAQVSLLRRPSTAAPYYWAAFTLNGATR